MDVIATRFIFIQNALEKFEFGPKWQKLTKLHTEYSIIADIGVGALGSVCCVVFFLSCIRYRYTKPHKFATLSQQNCIVAPNFSLHSLKY